MTEVDKHCLCGGDICSDGGTSRSVAFAYQMEALVKKVAWVHGIEPLSLITARHEEIDRVVLAGAILTEVCMEASDGLGSWDRIIKKQEHYIWKGGVTPTQEEWLQALQMFQSAECLCRLEVQCPESECAIPKSRKRRKINLQGHDDFLRAATKICEPPNYATEVVLVECCDGTKAFPQYHIKHCMAWPQNDFFKSVFKILFQRMIFPFESAGNFQELPLKRHFLRDYAPAVPKHWPESIMPDLQKRVVWLPLDWGQAVKKTSTGKPCRVFISPQGKMFYHKKAIAASLGHELPDLDVPATDGLGRRLVWEPSIDMDCTDRPQHWPDGIFVNRGLRANWLPADWGEGFKVTSSGKLCRCYISPSGKVCYHKYNAETVVGISLPKINLPLDGVGTGIDFE